MKTRRQQPGQEPSRRKTISQWEWGLGVSCHAAQLGKEPSRRREKGAGKAGKAAKAAVRGKPPGSAVPGARSAATKRAAKAVVRGVGAWGVVGQ